MIEREHSSFLYFKARLGDVTASDEKAGIMV